MAIIKTSRLKCPKCGHRFYYKWLPGGSFTSIRLGTSRYMRCPNCKKWSMFNIWKTRTNKKPNDNSKRYNDAITTITYAPMIAAFVLLVVFTSLVFASIGTNIAIELIIIEISAMLLTCFSLIFKILPKEEI